MHLKQSPATKGPAGEQGLSKTRVQFEKNNLLKDLWKPGHLKQSAATMSSAEEHGGEQHQSGGFSLKKTICWKIYENAFRFKLVFTRFQKTKSCFWRISNNFTNCTVHFSHNGCIFFNQL